MKKKIFFAPNTIRTAKWVISSVIALGGSLAIFYALNDTFPEGARFASNARFAKSAGVFESDKECFDAVDTPTHSAKRRFAEKAYQIAKQNNLIDRKDISEEQIADFFKSLDDPANFSSKSHPFTEFDHHATSLEEMCETILEKAELLSYSDPTEFKRKKSWFGRLALICNSLDGQGTFVSNFNRERLHLEILKRVYDFQTNSTASSFQKSDLVASCVPALQEPYDLALMFRMEDFRIQSMIDILRGIKKFDPASNVIEGPKPLNGFEKFQLVIPGVDSAWRSKLHFTFAKAIVDLQKTSAGPNSAELKSLGQAVTNLYEDPANTAYLRHFRIDFYEFGAKFNDKELYTYKLTHPKSIVGQPIETKN